MTDGKNCGATTKDGGGDCELPAGWGTDHSGSGKCKLHGGSSEIQHGLYSKNAGNRLADKIEEIREADGEITDLENEIALARAAVSELIEGRDSLPADDVESLLGVLDRATRIVKRHNEIQYGTKFTIQADEIGQFVEVVKNTINVSFDDCDSPQELQDEIGTRLAEQTDEDVMEGGVTDG